MNNILVAAITLNLFGGLTCIDELLPDNNVTISEAVAGKLDIKIKNDSDDEVTVINDGIGGTYRLQKNVTTTIKMDVGDKLYLYEKGKKGALLLIANETINGKVQLLSKL